MFLHLKKLPNLTTKLRQEIKMEPISEDSSSSANSTTHSVSKENNVNSVDVKREKISVGIRSQANSSADTVHAFDLVVLSKKKTTIISLLRIHQ